MELRSMELFSSFVVLQYVFLHLSLFHYSSFCQQTYLSNETYFDCNDNAASTKGYFCGMGHLNSCMSFVSYRSRAPYNTADSIGTLLGSDASEISSLNHISSTSEKIPADQLILVPVSCTCSGNIFQHFTPYKFLPGQNYSGVAHIDFQSLTTCQAVAGQNNYNPDQIPTETEFIVPVRCACPSEKQAASGVTSLLTYTIYNDTGVTSIGERSRTPYDTAITIGHLFGSEASEIASLNHMSSLTDKIPMEKLILVPVSCTCSGNIFQHFTPFTVKSSETYFGTANKTYQGLTTCQALIDQNYYDPDDIPVGSELMVPVRCACPTEKQTANGVSSLLTYTIYKDDVKGVTSIGEKFGVNQQSILEANMLSQNSTIYLFTPILVPLKGESCSIYPELFFCKCPNSYLPDGNCRANDKSFPVKLVASLGVGIGIVFLCLFLLVELEVLCKSQRCLQIEHEPELLKDKALNMHATFDAIDESMEQSISFSLVMESAKAHVKNLVRNLMELKTMEDLFSSFTLHVFLYLSLFHQSSYSQQAYINNQTLFNCSDNASTSKGYLCDIGHVKSCMSFVFFRSRTPYDTALTIGQLLGSEASEIASLNNISSSADKIPANKSILVPVSCTCSGNIYQHYAPYTVKKSDTYYRTATETYQGLTTCQAMISQNYYDPEEIPVGAELTVPVRCACPTENQTNSGVASLLTYTPDQDDVGVTSIGKRFGVDGQSILEANMLSPNSIELEGLYKTQSSLQIEQEPELLRDKKVPDMYATFHTSEEPIEQSISSSLEMESVSF
ncbi:hypothetical protein FEM48_Zijuj02G0182100 [Ziziphus jujuba var. spinosa]|uniref:LysM domain-containing protein n=1 Tax=Ziziphus jujuba var. spinosa TaxID=714518 RepID=A0A978VX76_ZIZJJ|nr:hypothetical protein FEM48_Zijuj02G0182100 [Ziziphus jujuba var. spinosa]